MSSLRYMTSTILFTYAITTVHSQQFNQTLCFPTTANITSTQLLPSYHSIITTLINDTFNIETSSCTPITFPFISTNLYSCFTCILDPTISMTETSRYTTLSAINNNINTTTSTSPNLISNIQTNISPLSYISYASSPHAPINPACISLPYPRICQYDLSAASVANSIPTQFIFTLALNNATNTLQFEILRDAGEMTNWFAFGFGPVGMDGDTIIYSCGWSLCGDAVLVDYRIQMVNNSRVDSSVVSDVLRGGTNDIVNIVQTSEGAVEKFTFERAFDTGDIWDFQFSGHEEDVDLFAAVGLKNTQKPSGSTVIANHGGTHVVRSHKVLFVPEASIVDRKWCGDMVVGDCIIAVNVIETDNPSMSPSDNPSMNPSRNPSKILTNNPSKIPTSNPVHGPAETPTDQSTTDSAYKCSLFMVFVVMVVIIAI